MDRFTSLTRLRAWWLTWQIDRLIQHLLKDVNLRRSDPQQELLLSLLLAELAKFRGRRPQMWLETHPPQDQPSPTP